MAFRISSVGRVIGLALLVVVAGGRAAQAGTVGIIITSGGTAPTGDPFYTYYFDVELAAGYTLNSGGYFTVYDLPGVISGSLTGQPSLYWGSSIQFQGITPTGTPTITDSPTVENVTWQYNGSAITAGSSAVDLGIFRVQTEQLSSQPTPDLLYVGSLGGNTYTDQGTIQVNAIVPEPSSIVLLASGCLLAPVLIARSRWKRNRSRVGPD